MKKTRLGFALTGSFCTFDKAIPVIETLVGEGYDIVPIMSEYSYTTDTRFGKAADFAMRLEMICDHAVIHTIAEAEPIGPEKLLDLLVIAPCTGNTLGKLAVGIADTSVTMAAKSHLRNQSPLLIGISSNDALGNSSKNIGSLFNYKNVYFVPMRQDAPHAKPRSMVADFSKIPEAVKHALTGTQMQPVYLPQE